jgi:dolichol-phosphate mannosyltransferase
MKRELSVVIPTFNEKENLTILIPRILDIFKKNQIDGEIVIVDDRSTDGSFEFLTEQVKSIPELKVIFRTPPPSISRAWFEGFDAASKQNIVCIDADLCHDPEYFPQMLEKLEEYDLVIGSRYTGSFTNGMREKSLLTRFISFVGQHISRFTLGFTETDTSHSFRMFRKEVFSSIKNNLTKEGNVFLIQFLYYTKRHKFNVTEIPIVYGKRIYGKTKLKIMKEGIRYLRFVINATFHKLS